ncbi:ATP-binding protein [Amycolatopsis sp. CA-230715]|uniref:ATP-binding protein n=1 Tax=Amycolatopsis sp. CA-230715 TaxID=2745196 RepID=UPI001C342056|nr:sensor histidine kinase [Amycolatopsis sp. CA-230715]QWF77183.1 Sensor histidine kinase DcuS [Amycolatopsis sp. CA-230715]
MTVKSRRPRGRRFSLAGQLLVVQTAGVAVLVAVGFTLAYFDARTAVTDRSREEATTVAATIADTPSVLSALSTEDPSVALQPFAEKVRADTGVDFVTIMNTDGIRYTHPTPSLIGQRFAGNIAEALRGKVFTETYLGTLGESVRAVVPVFDRDHRVVALVSAGITIKAIAQELGERLPPLVIVAIAVLLVGIGGSLLVGRRLRRQTRGFAPAELSGMFGYYEAILHTVREGLVLVNASGTVVLCNHAARELLGLDDDPAGREVDGLGLADPLARSLVSGPRTDEIHVTETRVLVVNTEPVSSDGRERGTVVTLRDHTELQALTGELTTIRGLAESLRSQAHESANRLHTVVSLVEMGRPVDAVEFATEELAVAQHLTDRVLGAVEEPVLAALLLGKAAEAAERGADLELTPDSTVDATVTIPSRDLVTVLGNLVDNAIDAAIETAAQRRPRVTVTVRPDGDSLLMRVSDTGDGVPTDAADAVFRRGWTTKPGGGEVGHGLGLALAAQVVRRHRGTIEVDGAVFTVRLPGEGSAG